MEYTVSYNEELNSIISHAQGPLTVEDVSSLIDDSIPLIKQHSTANYIGDYTDASSEGLTTNHIWLISVDSNRLSEHLEGKKLAVVFKDDVHFGLGRMWQSFTEIKVPFEIKLFRTREDAESWVKQ